jgi:hypothetical protein
MRAVRMPEGLAARSNGGMARYYVIHNHLRVTRMGIGCL